MDEKFKKIKKEVSDLSDIVLEKESKKSESTKKWLLTIASAIILFLIILLIMKMLNQPDIDTGTEESLTNTQEHVEPMKQDQEIATTDESKEQKVDSNSENLFKKEPIIDETTETDIKFEEMVKKLKEQDVIEEATTAKPETEEAKSATNSDVIKRVQETAEKIKKEVPVVTTTKTQTPTTTTVVETITPPTQIVQEETIKPKKRVVHKAPKPKKVVKKSPAKSFENVHVPSVSGYFIQVGATTASFPNRKFLQKIKNAGFDYIVHTVYVKGRKIKKVLVGPYRTRDNAKAALPKVKANINPSAYIYKLQ